MVFELGDGIARALIAPKSEPTEMVLGVAGITRNFLDYLIHIAGHGALGGAVNVMMGEKFGDGFLSGAFGAFSSYIPGGNGSFWTRTLKASILGGTGSVLGGGKFANGAYTAAFQHLFNEEAVSVKNGLSRILNQHKAEACTAVAACNLHATVTGELVSEEKMIELWKKYNGDRNFSNFGASEESMLGPLNELGKKYGITYKYKSYDNLDSLNNYAAKNVPVLSGLQTSTGAGHAVVIHGIWTSGPLAGKAFRGYSSSTIVGSVGKFGHPSAIFWNEIMIPVNLVVPYKNR